MNNYRSGGSDTEVTTGISPRGKDLLLFYQDGNFIGEAKSISEEINDQDRHSQLSVSLVIWMLRTLISITNVLMSVQRLMLAEVISDEVHLHWFDQLQECIQRDSGDQSVAPKDNVSDNLRLGHDVRSTLKQIGNITGRFRLTESFDGHFCFGVALDDLNEYIPQGVWLDAAGTIYVADSGNHQLMRWCRGATRRTVLVGENVDGKIANQVYRPIGLSSDHHGNLSVVDKWNHRVQRFLLKNNWLKRIFVSLDG